MTGHLLWRRPEVARYRFHVVCREWTFLDNGGQRFRCARHALEHAARIKRELAADGDAYHDCAVQVVDEDDRELAMLAIRAPES